MANKENFSSNYLLLQSENLSFFDFIRIFRGAGVQSSYRMSRRIDDLEEEFGRSWLLLISLVLQTFFMFIKKPLAVAGDVFELCLNYPAANGGYKGLIWNLITGKLVRPDKSSGNFVSVLGISDKRVDLDMNITNQSKQYYPTLAMMASKLSYENSSFARNVVTDKWQMKFLGFFNFWNDYQEQYTKAAFMFQDKAIDPNLIVVAFRGTEPFDADAWRTDCDLSWYEFEGLGKIHAGFLKALGMQKSKGWPKENPKTTDGKEFAYYFIREKLKSMIRENENAKIMITGHSLGGAMAILFASILSFHEEEELLDKLEGVYTFGQPRVGDEQFGEYMKRKMKENNVNYCRFVYCNDIVPRLPFDYGSFFYKHFGPCFYFNSLYVGQVLEEEPDKNYFSLLLLVPKMLNAVFQLIRSVFMPLILSKEYEEGWLMKMCRVIALIVPGIVDHFPFDYVNLTRLGELVHK